MATKGDDGDDSTRMLMQLKRNLNANKDLIAQLQAANEELEATIAATDHFRFLDLPLELRDIIYELCVAPGAIALGRSRMNGLSAKVSDELAKPHWPLLAVNRQIRKEAAAVLFQKNTVTINDICTCEMGDRYDISLESMGRRHLRSAAVNLSTQNLMVSGYDSLDFAGYLRHTVESSGTVHQSSVPTSSQRVSESHEMAEDFFANWRDMLCAASSMGLCFLEVNIVHCYCLLGCHRMVKGVADAMDESMDELLELPKLQTIEVLGIKSSAERDVILEVLIKSFSRMEDNWLGAEPRVDCVVRFKVFIGPPDDSDMGTYTGPRLDFYDVEEGLEDCEISLRERAGV